MYQKPLLFQREANTMAKEEKKPGKGSQKAERQRPKGVGDEKGTVRNHDSRQDNVVKKE